MQESVAAADPSSERLRPITVVWMVHPDSVLPQQHADAAELDICLLHVQSRKHRHIQLTLQRMQLLQSLDA